MKDYLRFIITSAIPARQRAPAIVSGARGAFVVDWVPVSDPVIVADDTGAASGGVA
jgi:hypothetical protein